MIRRTILFCCASFWSVQEILRCGMEVARTSVSGPEVRPSRTWPPGTGMPWSEDPAAGLAASSSTWNKKENTTDRFQFPFCKSSGLHNTGGFFFRMYHKEHVSL
ncbi:hypothetical protein NPIL_410531 [Nephila pilipes]|uniref:Secreted protein n=1 Tax=Nephila pilipes TaxID=299642 RepID=A0A8X6PP32_NEPPI|nr:hypothetical protein NPIL_410531 [Nephila pilipes]